MCALTLFLVLDDHDRNVVRLLGALCPGGHVSTQVFHELLESTTNSTLSASVTTSSRSPFVIFVSDLYGQMETIWLIGFEPVQYGDPLGAN